jgi:hypothetical protein
MWAARRTYSYASGSGGGANEVIDHVEWSTDMGGEPGKRGELDKIIFDDLFAARRLFKHAPAAIRADRRLC